MTLCGWWEMHAVYHLHLGEFGFAILSRMTANQRPRPAKSIRLRQTIVPNGRTVIAHVTLLPSVEARTEIVRHARRSVLPTG